MELVCCLAMKDPQVYHHLLPLARHPLVSRLWIVRSHQSAYGTIPKAEYVLTPMPKPWRWLQMLRRCHALAARHNVAAFLSFNPYPYGLISLTAAYRYNIPIHFGYVGKDWHQHMTGSLRHILLVALRKASFITVSGSKLRKKMIEYKISEEKIAVLPHSIDINKFQISKPENAKYDAVFVGELISRKNVDVILRAFSFVVRVFPNISLCIVGDGPDMFMLQQMTKEFNISSQVVFVGAQKNVQPFIASSRIAVMASSQEGFPFFLVEAISTGIVPVCTPVAAIPEYITDGVNGLLFPVGDASSLAEKIKLRSHFSYDHATKVWDPWLEKIALQNKRRLQVP